MLLPSAPYCNYDSVHNFRWSVTNVSETSATSIFRITWIVKLCSLMGGYGVFVGIAFVFRVP